MKAAVVLLAVALSTCSRPPGTLEEVLETGQLTVITRNSPTTYYRGSRGYEGPEYDLVAAFSTHLSNKYDRDIEVSYLMADQLPEIFAALEDNRAHLAAAGLTVTPERLKRVDFGPAYRQVSQYLVYRLNSGKPENLQQLRGKRLEVLAGSSFAETLRSHSDEVPGLAWTENPHASVGELLRAVQRQQLDYTVVDSNDYYVHRFYMPDLRKAFKLKEEDDLAWAFGKDRSSELIAEVDEFMAAATSNGLLERIRERYYGHTKRFDYVGARTFKRDVKRRLPQYRVMFEAAAENTQLDWRILAAIGYQESHWNPDAVSPTGVRGLMMLTGNTATGLGVDDRNDAEQSIAAGSQYFRNIYDRLADVPHPDRTWFALAAYNVGFGHLQDARRLARKRGLDPNRWVVIQQMLPLLAEREYYSTVPYGYARGWEPVRYVQNVRTYLEILTWLTLEESRQPAPDTNTDIQAPGVQTAAVSGKPPQSS
ncbi:MAG: membrane-bound lytic murein transglycosylase MltF [Gammaproteobacteria bacterium]|nr:membrane-bound lytic murein transglycosylase MltF [Gammaproteobacteria bacterium]